MLAYLFGWTDEGVEETCPKSRRQKYLSCKLIQKGGIKLKPNTPCITDIITIEPKVDTERIKYEKKRLKRHKKLLRPIM
jgi:hypothetical protein